MKAASANPSSWLPLILPVIDDVNDETIIKEEIMDEENASSSSRTLNRHTTVTTSTERKGRSFKFEVGGELGVSLQYFIAHFL
jgi:hypothetical protein